MGGAHAWCAWVAPQERWSCADPYTVSPSGEGKPCASREGGLGDLVCQAVVAHPKPGSAPHPLRRKRTGEARAGEAGPGRPRPASGATGVAEATNGAPQRSDARCAPPRSSTTHTRGATREGQPHLRHRMFAYERRVATRPPTLPLHLRAPETAHALPLRPTPRYGPSMPGTMREGLLNT